VHCTCSGPRIVFGLNPLLLGRAEELTGVFSIVCNLGIRFSLVVSGERCFVCLLTIFHIVCLAAMH
jgi:hypothetical protein